MRVLLIDDDAMTRRCMARLLASAGIQVVAEAGDGRQALTLIAALPRSAGAELIITDCQMPVMDGLSFTRTLRAADARTPVIMVTSLGPAMVEPARQAGVNRYLRKPVDFDELLRTIRGLAGQLPAAA